MKVIDNIYFVFIESIVKACLLLCLLTVIPIYLKGQSLNIGDKVPNIIIENILDKPNEVLSFSNLEGKPVLIDFWNIWCSSCIASMPKLDSLQYQFKGKIQILLVTKNSETEVKKLFDRLNLQTKNLKFITSDTLLSQLFPHQTVPHHIWIDSKGIYKHATFEHNATQENIEKFIEGVDLNLSLKEQQIAYFENISLFEEGCDKDDISNIISQSILLKNLWKKTAENSIIIERDSLTGFHSTLKAINITPLGLLQLAFNKYVYGFDVGLYNLKHNHRMIIEANNPIDLFPPHDHSKIDKWSEENLLSYEVKVHPLDENSLFFKAQEELNRLLSIKGSIESRFIDCYVLVKENKDNSANTKGGKYEVQTKGGKLIINNAPMYNFIRQVIYHQQDKNSLPLIDDTQILTNIDLIVDINSLNNLDKLNYDLLPYGLKIIKQKRQIPMLVIRHRD